jgi:predicted dehydrogenase
MLILPDPLHEPCTIQALEAGKFVVCTKPMADTIESAFRIADAAEKHAGHYMLGFQISNGAFAQAVLGVLETGVLGTPRQIRFDYHRHPWRAMHRYRNSPVDGAMVKEGTHWLDLIHRLNGQLPWRAIAGFSGNEVLGDLLEFEDSGVVIIDYEGGFRAAHTYSYYRRTAGPEEDFLLVGDKGTLRGSFTELRLDSDTERRTIRIPAKAMPAEHHYGYVAMHDEFAAMVLDGKEPYSNWRNGLENMLTCHGAQLAVAGNRVVQRTELAHLDWRERPGLGR